MIYIFLLIVSLISVWVLARMDKNLSTKLNLLNDESGYDMWFEYYNGRKIGYKVLYLVSLIPMANALVALISIVAIVCLLIYKVSKSKFWDKIL